MTVYNITVKILPEIEKDWIAWQKEEHIPAIMSTGLFTENRFFRLLDQEEEDGLTYVVQYFSETRDQYDQYINKHAGELRKQAFARWGDRFIAFRTLMEEI